MWREGVFDHVEPAGLIVATANSSGLAQGYLGPAPAGYCWYVERYTSWVNAARTTSTVEIFVQSAPTLPAGFTATAGDRSGRQDIAPTGANNICSDNNSPVYVPEGYFLVAFWAGLTSGDTANLSTQIAVHLKDPTMLAPRFQVVQQTEPLPDVNADDALEELTDADGAMHETADMMREFGKAL